MAYKLLQLYVKRRLQKILLHRGNSMIFIALFV